MAEQSNIIHSVDNFKPVFKYYKRRNPAPNFNNAVDFHKGFPKERLELLKSHNENNTPINSHENFEKFGLNPTNDWHCLKLLDVDSKGDSLSSGLILLSNVFTKEGQILWSLKCLKDYAKNPPNKTNIENVLAVHKNKDETLHQDFLENSKSPNKKYKIDLKTNSKNGIENCISNHRENPFNEEDQQCLDNLKYDWWENVYGRWRSEKLLNTTKCTNEYRLPKISSRLKTDIDELRWATLGYHHNWDTKRYSDKSVSLFPNDLNSLCKIILSYIRTLDQQDIKKEFIHAYKPEAAIVNFYPTHSSLGGHTDHSEPNRKSPLLSFSFGLSAIFLCGGPTKETKPTAMILRSGDILIMTETAREKFHGVPRIIDSTLIESSKTSTKNETIETNAEIENLLPNCYDDSDNCAMSEQSDIDEIMFTKMYLSNHRININVRQVF